MKSSTILVTGSTGAIGGALQDISSQEFGDRTFVFASSADCDLTDKDATAAFIARVRPDSIIHLAAIAGGVGINAKHPARLLRDNVLISINVLEAARAASTEKIVMALSSGIYSPSAPLPLREETLHDGAPDSSNYGYAFAKRLIEPLIRAYSAEHQMNIIGLLPNNTIGEHSSFREGDSGVVPALIRRFYENRTGDSPLVVWGDGSPLREISNARDLARIFMWCLDNYNSEEVLNVGTTEELSIKEIAYIIADALEISRNRIVFDESKPAGPERKNTDTTRLTRLHAFSYTPARETISSLATYFAERYGDSAKLRL